MVKKIIVILLLICLTCPLFATLDMSKAEDYDTEEFPKWTLDLRRSETIFFGALPLTFIATNAVLSLAGSNMKFMSTLGIAAGLSAGIMVTDIILGIIE